MKYGKYLLLKIENDQATFNGIYLPKYAKIVHFGELEVTSANKDSTSSSKVIK